MTRRLLTTLTGLSLLLCVATAVVYVGSHWSRVRVRVTGHWEYDLPLSCGQMRLDVDRRYVTPVADAEQFRNPVRLGVERLERSHGAPGWVYHVWQWNNPQLPQRPSNVMLGLSLSQGETLSGSIPL